MKIKIEEVIDQIISIARMAGDAIMEIYNNDADFNVEAKADDSPLTKADKAANDIICKFLKNLDDSIPIISEENKMLDYSIRKNWEYCWLVDPLDGTKEFIKKNGEFTVNIALIYKGRVVAGVVYAPALNEMYYAIKSEGAYLIREDQKIQLKANAFSLEDKGLKVVCSRSHLNQDTQDYLDKLNEPQTVSKGSSLKFLILASNGANVYPRLAPTMEWDTAAAHIILQESGGRVVQKSNNEELEYNKENLLNPHFIAYANESS